MSSPLGQESSYQRGRCGRRRLPSVAAEQVHPLRLRGPSFTWRHHGGRAAGREQRGCRPGQPSKTSPIIAKFAGHDDACRWYRSTGSVDRPGAAQTRWPRCRAAATRCAALRARRVGAAHNTRAPSSCPAKLPAPSRSCWHHSARASPPCCGDLDRRDFDARTSYGSGAQGLDPDATPHPFRTRTPPRRRRGARVRHDLSRLVEDIIVWSSTRNTRMTVVHR